MDNTTCRRMTIIRTFAALCAACCLVHAAWGDATVTLSGTYTSDYDRTFTSDTTINLAGVTFTDCSMKLRAANEAAALTFTINLVDGTQNVFTQTANKDSCLKATKNCNLVITGGGTLKLTGEKRIQGGGVLECNNLTVQGGDTHVTFDNDKSDTSCAYVKGNYRQTGGKFKVEMAKKNCTNEFYGVNLVTKNTTFTLENGAFNVELGGTKSRGINLRGSCTATFLGGSSKVSFEGPEGRFVSGGTLRFEGGEFSFATNITKSMTAAYMPTNVAAVKADYSITVTGGDFEADLPLAGSEVFTTDSETGTSVAISGGIFDLVAGNDCIHATGNISISGGRIRAVSTGDDAIDANGGMVISGGDIRAYATAAGAHALDVNKGDRLTINGGTIVGTDGLDAIRIGSGDATVGKTTFNQPTYYGQVSTSVYGGKYLTLDGSTNGVAFTVKPRLPNFPPNRLFNLFVSVPGRAASAPVAQTVAEAYADANSRTPLVFEKKATIDGRTVTTKEGDVLTLPAHYDLSPTTGKTKTISLALNALATPTIDAIAVADGVVRVGVATTRTGLTYRLGQAETPAAGAWTDVGDEVAGNGQGRTLTTSASGGARFFKVKVGD